VSKQTDIFEEYRALETRVLASLRADLGEEQFGGLALDIHAFQTRWNRPYARWCATLPRPSTWREIPAVPQAMFRLLRLSCFPPKLTQITFRTSGTTGERRGEHHLPDTTLYRASALAGWRSLRIPRLPTLVLAQPRASAPDSSLSQMFHWLAIEGTASAEFNIAARTRDIERIASSGPCALFGTALAFLALFDRLGGRTIPLPAGSFALETGGYKGSGRDIPKAELYRKFRAHLGLPPDSIWNEYGMTELSSQAYTRGLGRPHRTSASLRAIVIDPGTGKESAVGEAGVLRLFDVANVGSVLAIQTADLAVRRKDGFELLGRDPAAVPRGCSRRADELLRGSPAPATAPQISASTMPDSSRLPLPDTANRARFLARAASAFPFLGKVSARGLLALITSELGHAAVLDRFIPQGRRQIRAIAPRRILHVLSGNTPAAALQTILRGLLLGSENFCKLPSGGLPEADTFRSLLPRALAERLHLSQELPATWIAAADAAVIFGRDETVTSFRSVLPSGIPVIAHGHKFSLAIVSDDSRFRSVNGAARDVSVFDQQGCLSPHVFFVREKAGLTAGDYARRLARAMARFETHTPRGALTLSEADSIRTLREEIAFRAANAEPLELLASAGTEWTVVVDRTDEMPLSPLNRVVFVKPLPKDLAAMLTPHRAHLSTCGIWPVNVATRDFAAALGFTRICAIGKMQSPPLDWHQDGQSVLAPLVRWVDCEG